MNKVSRDGESSEGNERMISEQEAIDGTEKRRKKKKRERKKEKRRRKDGKKRKNLNS